MNCPNCGKEVKDSINFCPSCGNKLKENIEDIKEEVTNQEPLKGSYEMPKTDNVTNNTVQPDPVKIKEEETANILCIVSLCFYFFGTLIGGLLSFIPGLGPILSGLSPLIGIGIMIYVRVKYPNNKFGKVLMIIYIVLTILAIIAILILVMMCASIAQRCGSMG